MKKIVKVIYEEMNCPKCNKPHIDSGEWEKRLHKTHLCLFCKHLWKPHENPSFGIKSNKEE